MINFFKKTVQFAAAIPIALSFAIGAAQAEKIKIALAEAPSDELAAFFVALDRARANGLDYEWTAFSDEELAIQAVLSGQMDIGFGTPYAAMQRSKAPLRIIFQLSKLKFFPVTTTKYASLKDLDGEPILLHSRGGGTDSIANVIEDRLGMQFGKRSYVPGSSNRVAALLGGRADATIIDLSNKNKLMRSEAGENFNVLEMFEVEASDEALFGNLDWIKNNEKDVDIFVTRFCPFGKIFIRIQRLSVVKPIPMDQSVNCPLKSWQSLMGFTPMPWQAVFMIRMGAAEKLQMPIWNGTRLLVNLRATPVI
jgi:NitT/TauT family transport system substrate-binding protein